MRIVSENTEEASMYELVSYVPWLVSSLKNMPHLHSRASKGSSLSFGIKPDLPVVMLFKL